MQRLIIRNMCSCSNGIYHLHSLALHTSIQIQLQGALFSGLLSDVYSKSKPTRQYEKVASAGGQIYLIAGCNGSGSVGRAAAAAFAIAIMWL
jgi:hypothetical protein